MPDGDDAEGRPAGLGRRRTSVASTLKCRISYPCRCREPLKMTANPTENARWCHRALLPDRTNRRGSGDHRSISNGPARPHQVGHVRGFSPARDSAHSIVEAIPDAVAVVDLDGVIVDVNRHMVALTGRAATGWSAHRCEGASPTRPWPSLISSRRSPIGWVADCELALLDRGWSAPMVSWSASTFQVGSSGPDRLLVVARDGNEQARALTLASLVQSADDRDCRQDRRRRDHELEPRRRAPLRIRRAGGHRAATSTWSFPRARPGG